MTYPVLQRQLNVHLDNARWAVRSIDEQASGILGPVDYGWHRYDEYLAQVMARACGHTHLNDFCIDDLTTWNREMADLTGIAYGGVARD